MVQFYGRLTKIGNSYGIIVPKHFVKTGLINKGSTFDVEVKTAFENKEKELGLRFADGLKDESITFEHNNGNLDIAFDTDKYNGKEANQMTKIITKLLHRKDVMQIMAQQIQEIKNGDTGI